MDATTEFFTQAEGKYKREEEDARNQLKTTK
jgi:hypothetical protein